MSGEAHPSDLAALEATLAALVPAAPPLSRDRLLFEAGRASVRRARWPWLVTALNLAVLLPFGGLVLTRAASPPVERIVYVRVVPPSAPAQATANPVREASNAAAGGELIQLWPRAGYLTLERDMIRWGPDAFPEPAPLASAPEPPLGFDRPVGTISRPDDSGWFPIDRILKIGDRS
jgi:hypothetical protein